MTIPPGELLKGEMADVPFIIGMSNLRMRFKGLTPADGLPGDVKDEGTILSLGSFTLTYVPSVLSIPMILKIPHT